MTVQTAEALKTTGYVSDLVPLNLYHCGSGTDQISLEIKRFKVP